MSKPLRILVVDDDVGITSLLCEELEEAGFSPTSAHSVSAAVRMLEAGAYDLVVSDLILQDGRGEEVLRAVRKTDPSLPVIIITAFGSIELATDLVRRGASDFLTKPFTPTQLVLSVSRAIVQRQFVNPKDDLVESGPETSPSLKSAPASSGLNSYQGNRASLSLEQLLARAASSDANLLLVGESGVGKTRIAKTVHEASSRREKPFVTLNCAAISASLVESELFGVIQGAFTDARRNRSGLIQSAHGGTLFLDEIADMPLEAQAKLLRVLEKKVVRPVGGTSELAVDIRVISATNQSLEQAVAERRFRADLYYRLHVLKIEIPPLRERREEILQISHELLQEFCKQSQVVLSEDAKDWIMSWHWPGNIRELANRFERAIALSDRAVITAEDLADSGEISDQFAAGNVRALSFVPRTLAEVEREHIAATLDYTKGNKSLAAELLGIDRKTLYRKLNELGED